MGCFDARAAVFRQRLFVPRLFPVVGREVSHSDFIEFVVFTVNNLMFLKDRSTLPEWLRPGRLNLNCWP